MDEHDNDPLAQRLRQLPAERLPPAAVWQRIAAELETTPRDSVTVPMPRPITANGASRQPRRWPWLAGAAAAVLALIGSVALWMPQERSAPDSLLQAQANALTHEYRLAIAAIPQQHMPAELQPALREIDASADSIRNAIDQSPQAGFLLGQLQRTYALRLELTRQGLGNAGLSS
ncbi:hypothetical protein [Stenotrophomonas sp. SY1]|uniref:hypothetical protein n=1 Tax=Stenotrophomonas sp. SY1 TaxID=477235 RepID=UPI001E377777|nr:hypothetical protein [Stenotrophomonas sp. SY1]MCD9087449.1 hypothetical protein [Stenotrophomonas sp. SY1]